MAHSTLTRRLLPFGEPLVVVSSDPNESIAGSKGKRWITVGSAIVVLVFLGIALRAIPLDSESLPLDRRGNACSQPR